MVRFPFVFVAEPDITQPNPTNRSETDRADAVNSDTVRPEIIILPIATAFFVLVGIATVWKIRLKSKLGNNREEENWEMIEVGVFLKNIFLSLLFVCLFVF